MSTTTTPSLMARLLASGVPPRTAYEWATCPLPFTDDVVVADAVAWHCAGLSDPGDLDWYLDGWFAGEVVAAKLAGFSIGQARFIDMTLKRARGAHHVGDVTVAPVDGWVAWRSSGLMPHFICLCVATGHHRVDDGRALLAEIQRDPHLRATLELQLACQGIHLRDLV